MNQSRSIITTAILASIITILAYKPVSIAIFRLAEPCYACPIKGGPGGMIIRNDSMGEGNFGTKRSNGRSHSGIDIEAPIGTPVYASRSGIAFCGNVPTGYGKYVMIYHPDGAQSFYGHLSEWAISSAKEIRKGGIIGFVGKTGNASYKGMTPHLHFEIRKDGKPQDPQGLMK